MSNQSEVGISPVLLQAITQTLSNKVPSQKEQHQNVTKSQEVNNTALLQDPISVPVAAEQVSICKVSRQYSHNFLE